MKIDDISHVIYHCPDLDVIERFWLDFGLVTARRDADTLYMRGAGPAPYCYVARRSTTPSFGGVALRAASAEDFEEAKGFPGAAEAAPLTGPGSGECVQLLDPDGLPVQIVFGIEPAQPLPLREVLQFNYARAKYRQGTPQRIARGPAQIVRLGHALFFVTDLERTVDWYCSGFGMLPSDFIHETTPAQRLGAFLRCDRRDEWADHHTIGIFRAPPHVKAAKVHHISFEIQDADAQFLGHEWLRDRGHRHVWGIGRHLLGSQIFDYWYDPFGNIVEHYADGDMFRADKKTESFQAGPESLYQWGPPVPDVFFA
jgi:catechol 2,3-dioxygenase-like lactoylglutathione lyase family enzyme